MLKYRILSTNPAATFPVELTSHTRHGGAEGVNRDKMEPETLGGALRAEAGGGGRGGEEEEGEEAEEEDEEDAGRCAIETKTSTSPLGVVGKISLRALVSDAGPLCKVPREALTMNSQSRFTE